MITKHDGEEIVGEDEFKRPILSTNIRIGSGGIEWLDCTECGRTILMDVNGKTYFHRLNCKFTNGVGYGDERKNTTLPHHSQCDCYTCKPPKDKK